MKLLAVEIVKTIGKKVTLNTTTKKHVYIFSCNKDICTENYKTQLCMHILPTRTAVPYLSAIWIKGIQTMYTEIIWLIGNWQPANPLKRYTSRICKLPQLFSTNIPCRKSGCEMRPNKEKDLLQHRSGTNPDNVPCLLCLQLPPHHPPHPPSLLGLLHHQSCLQGGKSKALPQIKNFSRWCWRTIQWQTPGVSPKAPVTSADMQLGCVPSSFYD